MDEPGGARAEAPPAAAPAPPPALQERHLGWKARRAAVPGLRAAAPAPPLGLQGSDPNPTP